MNALIKNKKNPFALPLILNPCPCCGNTPKLMYSPDLKHIGLVHPDEDGHYVFVSDDATVAKENVESMVRDWNTEVLSARWSDAAIEKHFLYCRNYLIVDDETKAIINNYTSFEEAEIMRDVYEKHYDRKCHIFKMDNNVLYIGVDITPETTN